MRDVIHDYEGYMEASGIFCRRPPMVDVWHRDSCTISDVAHSCNFSSDLVIGINDNPWNWESEKDSLVIKDYLDIEVVRVMSIGIPEPRICSRPVLANKVYHALAQLGIFDEELVNESANPVVNNGLLYNSGSDTIICLIGLKGLFDRLVYRQLVLAVHIN